MPRRPQHSLRLLVSLLVMSMLLGQLFQPLPVTAQPLPKQPAPQESAPVVWTTQADGMHLTWLATGSAEAASPAAISPATISTGLALVQYGGYTLPMHLQTVLLADDLALIVEFATVQSQSWPAPLPAEPVVPPLLAGELDQPTRRTTLALPAAPLFVLREGRVRGQRVAVVAFSPLYQTGGQTQAVVNLQAFLPRAQPLTTFDSLLSWQDANPRLTPSPPGPTNAAALTAAVKVVVTQAGLQRIDGAGLIKAGLPAGAPLANLHLTGRGGAVAIEVRDGDSLLDEKSELRFYAPSAADSMRVGDRWNQSETYWLTVAAEPGLRMSERSVTPGGAPARSTAYDHGIWEDNQRYESAMPGSDGDHWFAASLFTTAAGAPAGEDQRTLTLTPTLPITADGLATATYTITGSARTTATHQLHVEAGQGVATFTWTTTEPYQN